MEQAISRRSVLRVAQSAVAVSGLVLLSGCYMSDANQKAATAELMKAAAGAPGYRRGTVQYIEGFTQGRFITGSFSFDAASEDEVVAGLDAVLSRMAPAAVRLGLHYEAFVNVSAYSTVEGVNPRVEVRHVIGGDPNASVRIREFLTHYGY